MSVEAVNKRFKDLLILGFTGHTESGDSGGVFPPLHGWGEQWRRDTVGNIYSDRARYGECARQLGSWDHIFNLIRWRINDSVPAVCHYFQDLCTECLLDAGKYETVETKGDSRCIFSATWLFLLLFLSFVIMKMLMKLTWTCRLNEKKKWFGLKWLLH